jgi:hypothetical protein
MRLGARLLIAAVCLCAMPTTGMATQTLSGVLPPGTRSKVLAFRRPARPQPMRFQFTAPPVNAGVNYALNFCIGAPANPCGLHSDIVVVVPKGQTRSATYSSALFATRVLTVGQGTRRPVPYLVKIRP